MRTKNTELKTLKLSAVSGYFLFFMITCLFYACSDQSSDEPTPSNEPGTGFLEVTGISTELDISSTEGRIQSANTDLWDFSILDDNLDTVIFFEDFINVPAQVPLLEGDYSAHIDSDNQAPSGFGDQFATFGGEQSFTIEDSIVTPVTITAFPTNTRVRIQYTDQTLAEFDEIKVTVKTPNVGGELFYDPNETRFGYFQLDTSIEIDAILLFTTTTGDTDSRRIQGTIPNPQAGNSFTVTIAANLLEGSGAFDIVVSDLFNESGFDLSGLRDPNADFVPDGSTPYTDPRDGQSYNVVKIQIGPGPEDFQLWTAEAHRFVPQNTNTFATVSGIDAVYYNFEGAIDAPRGTHLPSLEEWDRLTRVISLSRLIPGGDTGLNLETLGISNAGGGRSSTNEGFYWSSSPSTFSTQATAIRIVPPNTVANSSENRTLDFLTVRYIIDLR